MPILSCAAAALLAGLSGCGGRDERLTEMEKRLDYLTSELADQRAELERVREKIGATDERRKQP